MKKSILMLLSIVAFILITCQKEEPMVFNEIEPSLMESLALTDDMLENVAYGPERFIRTKGQPNVYEVSLSSIDFECILPPYVLTVINGEDDGSFRITSGRVYLDGEEIFGPSNFKKKVYQLEHEVEITKSSTLLVELASKPGSYIHICIRGEYNEECDENGLILWNKLGSEEEVLNSEFGPPLSFGNNIHEFVPGISGDAVTIREGTYYNMQRHRNIVFESLPEYLNTETGTVECYIKVNKVPIPYNHNPYRIFDGSYGLEAGIGLEYNDGTFVYHISFGGVHNHIYYYDFEIDGHIGEWVHIAIVWDRNGINRTTETLRIYINDEIVASGTPKTWGTTVGDAADIASGNDANIAGKFYVDELRIYSIAKTDFSDRLSEL